MKIFLILILFSFLFSCNKKEIEKDRRIHCFQISDCKHECELDSGQVLINDLTLDTLHVHVAHWMNCSWDEGYLENIIITNDTLNILLDRPCEGIEYDEDGNEMKIYTCTDCSCIFFIDIELTGIKNKPKSILVNSKSVRNGNGY